MAPASPIAPRKASREPGFWSDLRFFLGVASRSRMRGRLLALSFGILGVLIANVLGQIWLNRWNRAFFEALERRDWPSFQHELVVFLGIVALLLPVVVTQTYFREALKIRLRDAMASHLKERWLVFPVAYRLGFSGTIGENPDQRIQDDTRQLAELTAELGIGILQSGLLLISFIGVLWTLSGHFRLPLGGDLVSIPGYMVWCALAFAGIGTGLTFAFGRPLIGLNARRAAREADYRFALMRVNEHAEAVGLLRGEATEAHTIDARYASLQIAMQALAKGLVRLTWVTSGYGWLALVVPILAAAPAFFAGTIGFGILMQSADAFGQVQAALRWFVDQFPRVAEWRAALERVARFDAELASLAPDHNRAQAPALRRLPDAACAIRLQSFAVTLPDGMPLIAASSLELERGARILASGPSGIGKSTFLRVLAGQWPWASGTIVLPSRIMILPQRPYLPLGSLRDALNYPESSDPPIDAVLFAALGRVGLSALCAEIDHICRWDRRLSLGEQQRLGFARLLLHPVDWVMLDEATSALDPASEAAMLALFAQELRGTGLINIAHRTGLERFHTARLSFTQGPHGATLSLHPGAD
jgi:putative ATP-binding cassette transporter